MRKALGLKSLDFWLVLLLRSHLLNMGHQCWVPDMRPFPWGTCQSLGIHLIILHPSLHGESKFFFHSSRYVFQIWICFLFLQYFCQDCHSGIQSFPSSWYPSHYLWQQRKCGNKSRDYVWCFAWVSPHHNPTKQALLPPIFCGYANWDLRSLRFKCTQVDQLANDHD